MRGGFVVALSALFGGVFLAAACNPVLGLDERDPKRGAGGTGAGGALGGGGSVGGGGSSGIAGGGGVVGGSGGVAGGAPCGNDVIDNDEECDDGNTTPNDGCDAACAVECPGGTIHPMTFHCYVLDPTQRDWSGSLGACEARGPGWTLASPSSLAEFTWLVAVADVRAQLNTAPFFLWVGGNDLAIEGAYVWTSGEVWENTHWHAGEPNNSGDEDCINIWHKFNGDGLNDGLCVIQLPSVCERPPAGTL